MAWTCGCGGANRDEARFCNQCGAPKPSDPAAGRPRDAMPAGEVGPPSPPDPGTPSGEAASPASPPVRTGAAAAESLAPHPAKKSKTPLLIGGLVAAAVLVCACLLTVAVVVALPRLTAMRERGKQAKALGDLRAIAAACEAYQSETGTYPDTGHNEDSYYTMVDADRLEGFLVPKYARSLPAKDPWGYPYHYGVSADDREFIVICGGSDGRTTVEAIPSEPVTTSCFEDDIIWENGRLVQAPGGKQRRCQ